MSCVNVDAKILQYQTILIACLLMSIGHTFEKSFFCFENTFVACTCIWIRNVRSPNSWHRFIDLTPELITVSVLHFQKPWNESVVEIQFLRLLFWEEMFAQIRSLKSGFFFVAYLLKVQPAQIFLQTNLLLLQIKNYNNLGLTSKDVVLIVLVGFWSHFNETIQSIVIHKLMHQILVILKQYAKQNILESGHGKTDHKIFGISYTKRRLGKRTAPKWLFWPDIESELYSA